MPVTAPQLRRLRDHTPTPLLDSFERILVPSLALHNAFDPTPLDALITTGCAMFTRLTHYPWLATHDPKALPVTVFSWFRCLFHAIPDRTWIQQIPPALWQDLRQERWRLYEFNQILWGDLNTLRLNADLKAFLCTGCQTPQPPKQAIAQPTKPLTGHHAKILRKAFRRWLEEQLQSKDPRYTINQGHLIRCDPLQPQALFVHEQILATYETQQGLSQGSVYHTLKQHKHPNPLPERTYQGERFIQIQGLQRGIDGR